MFKKSFKENPFFLESKCLERLLDRGLRAIMDSNQL